MTSERSWNWYWVIDLWFALGYSWFKLPKIHFPVENRMSMDWFKGKSTGNHGFYHQIDRGFRLKFSHHPILWEWLVLSGSTPQVLGSHFVCPRNGQPAPPWHRSIVRSTVIGARNSPHSRQQTERHGKPLFDIYIYIWCLWKLYSYQVSTTFFQ